MTEREAEVPEQGAVVLLVLGADALDLGGGFLPVDPNPVNLGSRAGGVRKNVRALSRFASARAAQSSISSTAPSRWRGPPLVSAMRGAKKARTSSARACVQNPAVTSGR